MPRSPAVIKVTGSASNLGSLMGALGVLAGVATAALSDAQIGNTLEFLDAAAADPKASKMDRGSARMAAIALRGSARRDGQAAPGTVKGAKWQ